MNFLKIASVKFFSDGPVVLPPPAAAISPSGCFLLNMGDNTRIAQLSALLPPSLAFQEVPGDMPTYHQVVETRQQVLDILSGADDRLVVVLGPPADSEPAALTELATQLQALKPKFEKELLLIVLADAALQPEGTEAVQINRGLRQARELLLQINRLGLPTACEFADTITPQFFADLLSWSCVSAGSETLRELVSGLSMPAGLRAHFDDASAAVHATSTTGVEHSFLGVSGEGVCGIVQTAGNPDVHVLLRASSYLVQTAAEAKTGLEAACARVDAERAGAPIVLDGCGLDGPALQRLADAVVVRLGRAGEETPRPFHKGGVCGLSACPSSTKEVGPLLASLAAAVAGRRKSTKRASKRAAAATSEETNNLRIVGVRPLLPPACLLEELPREAAHEEVVRKGREELLGVLRGESHRVALLVGPPAVDDAQACLEFASP